MWNCWFNSSECFKTVDLTNNAIKTVGIHFSCHNETKTERNILSTFENIQKVLNVWNTKALTVEGRILTLKTLGIFKIL